MTDKTKSQTFQKIIEQQDIKDILNQPNVTFKNNRGKDKQRHGGLTIKFFSDTKEKSSPIVVNDDLSQNEIFYDAVDNFDTEKISQIQTITKEVAT
ncbi:hypothetical protein [Spiroplasma endosymbiont of Polydrusus pterygomalis]|uniref:hypothetical protein n=1 Tax=Spiroplasma endosymbiont of Polydrusus pterygomalis TaxID=3139327 RepID=UPI003CCB1008